VRRPRRHGERGQSTAFVITLLMVFVLFLSMVVNVGQAVNRRIGLQLVADAGAFTGGSRMAEGLNYIAWANGVLQDNWALTTDAWLATTIATLSECDALEAVHATHEATWYAIDVPLQAINLAYANIPYTEAKRVSKYNIADLFPGENVSDFEFKEADYNLDTGVIMPARDIMNLMDIEQVDGTDPKTSYPSVPPLGGGADRSYSQWCWYSCGPFCIMVRNQTWDFDTWYKKSSSGSKHFVWLVKSPKTKGLMFDGFFGPDLIPEMKAVAAARPVGGSIVDGDARYTMQLRPASKVMLTGLIMDEHYNQFGGMRLVVH
jgi:hypothetical protein